MDLSPVVQTDFSKRPIWFSFCSCCCHVVVDVVVVNVGVLAFVVVGVDVFVFVSVVLLQEFLNRRSRRVHNSDSLSVCFLACWVCLSYYSF